MKLFVVTVLCFLVFCEAKIIRIIQNRGLFLRGHGSAGIDVDPIEFSMFGVPTQIDFNAGGDVTGRTYIGENARFGFPQDFQY